MRINKHEGSYEEKGLCLRSAQDQTHTHTHTHTQTSHHTNTAVFHGLQEDKTRPHG